MFITTLENNGKLPLYLEKLIDEAVSQDFDIYPLSMEDIENEIFKDLMNSFEFSNIKVLYQKKVVSKVHNAPVIPKIQYLFGFKPVDGLCILAKSKIHKEVLCDGELYEIIRNSSSTVHSLMYLLAEYDEFRIWSYIPMDPQETSSEINNLKLSLRRKLFTNMSK